MPSLFSYFSSLIAEYSLSPGAILLLFNNLLLNERLESCSKLIDSLYDFRSDGDKVKDFEVI